MWRARLQLFISKQKFLWCLPLYTSKAGGGISKGFKTLFVGGTKNFSRQENGVYKAEARGAMCLKSVMAHMKNVPAINLGFFDEILWPHFYPKTV